MMKSLPTAEKPWNKRWAIVLRNSTESEMRMIGIVGLCREQEISYKLHPDFWRQGYMTEALDLFLQLFWATKGKNFSLKSSP
jgi:ribosomal-protein-alanine N-acetyltransferase